ncbi:MAG: GatB/YqeY domain-containing protein [Deltaproteobacteria bacterium]|nr:GatB/YqeY domain-containing protein [Deltaproteobacteria bacterium]
MKAKLQEDIKTAMKARDSKKLENLRSLMASIKQVEVDTRKELSDSDIAVIFQKEIKKRRDALQFAEQAKRDDLVEQNKAEIALIQTYLGEQLSEDKLREIIQDLISAGSDNIGKIMGGLNSDHKGKFEGQVASRIIKEILG